MTEYSPSQEFENEIIAAMVGPVASQEFINKLSIKLKNHVVQPKRAIKARLSWAIIALVLAMTISILTIGPQKVLAAVERFLAYFPGVGVVEHGDNLRILVDPIEIVRDGIIVRVEQVVVDPNRTVVIFNVNNIPIDSIRGFLDERALNSSPRIALPDNQILEIIGGEGNGWRTGYQSKLVFRAVPKDVTQIIFLIPLLENVKEGEAPEDWEFEIELQPAPDELTLMPVYELTLTETPSPDLLPSENQDSDLKQEYISEDHEINFIMDRVIELEDGYIFQGRISWLRETGFNHIFARSFRLMDANGQEIPTEYITHDDEVGWYKRYTKLWAFQIKGKDHPGPLTIYLDRMEVEKLVTDVTFEIDLGFEPQVGQKWTTSLEMLFEGKSIELTQYGLSEREGRGEEYYWIEFDFLVDPKIHMLVLNDKANVILSSHAHGETGLYNIEAGYFILPTGVRQMEIETITYLMEGDWQVSWVPPTSNSDPVVSPEPQICLTADKWEELKTYNRPMLPPEITGNLLIKTRTEDNLSNISLLSLRDMSLESFQNGSWSSLSPDGSKFAYSGSEGLYVRDLILGSEIRLEDILEQSNYPVWYPDSESILFLDSNENNVYRIQADGSDIERLVYVPEIIYPSGIFAGEDKLYYVALSQDGVSYRVIDLETGVIELLFLTDNTKPNSRPKLSPDGEWYLYSDRVFGLGQINSKIARSDGSDEKLLSSLDAHPVSPGAWSLDGKWVVVNVHHMDLNISKITPVIIQTETCELVVLPDNLGKVTGWGP